MLYCQQDMCQDILEWIVCVSYNPLISDDSNPSHILKQSSPSRLIIGHGKGKDWLISRHIKFGVFQCIVLNALDCLCVSTDNFLFCFFELEPAHLPCVPRASAFSFLSVESTLGSN